MLIMLARTKAAQSMDVSGLTGAAFSIAMTLYLLGETVSQAMQATSSAYVASRAAISVNEAALASKRVLGWSVVLGCLVCTAQLTALPHLLRLFTPNAAIQAAAAPAVVVGALIQITNPACCAMEGTAMGIGKWGVLWKTNVVAQVLTILSLDLAMRQGLGLVGVMSSFGVLNFSILIGLALRIYGKGGMLSSHITQR
jgi:Na+-driven multidrug efflux pump